MKLGIDLDGVVCDFSRAFWAYLNRLHGQQHAYAEPQGWYDWPPWTEEQLDEGWRQFPSAAWNFWRDCILPYPDEVEAMRSVLYDDPSWRNADFYYITSRTPSAGASTLRQTTEWLTKENLLPDNASVIVVEHPSGKQAMVKALALDAMIDDKLDTVAGGTPQSKWWLLDRPWNRTGRPAVQVVGSLGEWFAALRKNALRGGA